MRTIWILMAILSTFQVSLGDSEDWSAAYGTEGFADSNGVKIHYVTKGNGPLLILIHGFPDFWYGWRNQIAPLSEHYQVVAIDQRGYNKSDKPAGIESYALSQLQGDILAVIKHFGKERGIICGHDWGGLVAWSLAMEHPEAVDRLIICDLPHPRGFVRELANNPRQRVNSFYARNFQASDPSKIRPESFVVLVKLDDKQDRQRYLEAFKRSSAEAMLNYYRANFPNDPAQWLARDFPQVKCPVLMFHGRNDIAVLPAGLAGTWDWVDNELTIVTFPDAGHWVQFDRADDVTKRILNWLSMTRSDSSKAEPIPAK
jgi:pimeloyl-ACP methyl ester carboxylesterase